jgi:hypothetical protein
MEDAAAASPREHAVVESFTPVSAADGVLTVRRARPGAPGGTALQDMLAAVATRAAGRPMRVRLEAAGDAAPAPVSAPVPPPRPAVTLVAPARAPSTGRSEASPAAPTPAHAQPADAAAAAHVPPSADDRAVAMHPFVQQLSDLFDARIVRIEAAGTLPAAAVPVADAADAPEEADPAPDLDLADPGDR